MSFHLLSRRQKTAFKSRKLSYFSLWLMGFLVFVSLVAEIIANSKPLILKTPQGLFFPVFQNLSNSDLGLDSRFVTVDFRALSQQDQVWAVWPLIPYDPYESDRSYSRYPAAPDSKHWLGTDDRGRDVLARLIYGLRNSLLYAVSVWIMSYIIGTILGGIQGYRGGRVDFYMQRAIEIFNAIPALFLLIILVSILKPSLWLLIFFTSILSWIGISYYVRVEFLKLRKLEFVEAARSIGVSRFRLLTRHILPNAMTPILTFSPFALTAGITGLAGLDYLGFGLAPPAASWGELLNQAQKHFEHAWWLAVFPASALMFTLLLLNFIGEGLRQALDPRNGA